ncbi:FAD-dependent oxidoreductase, partial [Myxococcota bacterium]|nr:FAD-dependent oxidoreductase [Myxococcota bacterium]
MTNHRIENHPILKNKTGKSVTYAFNGVQIMGYEGEMISSALFAQGISVFGHHHRDGGAQGIFCANGQCSQCMVIVDGKPVKACMTPVSAGINVRSLEGLPVLEDSLLNPIDTLAFPQTHEVDVMVIGGGPAGLNGAIELGRLGVRVLIVDDKEEAGGKLSLQTHNFFGSVADCYAGTRGVEIGQILTHDLLELPSVELWLKATAVGVYSDKTVGVVCDGQYRLVKPGVLLVATGAREKTLVFPGSDLPGVYGAGAFQTLVNRDQVRCAERLFIIGGGNVGVIAAYHALQAGIDVVGLVEAMPACGGYKVHVDKVRRLGVPIWTSHTILSAQGDGKVERVLVAQIDKNFKPIPGTEFILDADTVLVAVGLSPVNELLEKALQYGMPTFSAGDAEEIAEASAAIFSGKITGRRIARHLGIQVDIPPQWEPLAGILKSRPGRTLPQRSQSFHTKASFSLFGQNIYRQDFETGALKTHKVTDAIGFSIEPTGEWHPTSHYLDQALPPVSPDARPANVYPVIHCYQEIPCNPCAFACPLDSITMDGNIMNLPEFSGKCLGCERCILACPGLAITLVHPGHDPSGMVSKIAIPYEFNISFVEEKSLLDVTDYEGAVIGEGRILEIKDLPKQDHRKIIYLEVPSAISDRVAGFRVRDPLADA